MRRWLTCGSIGWALLLGASATGCAPQMHLAVDPDDKLNEQRPAYLLVRNVDAKTYLEETYQTAAAKVMAPDDSVLESVVVFPGTRQEIKLSPPAKGQVAVYVFFYRPAGEWKAILPAVAESYDVKINGSRLEVKQR